MNVMKNMEAIFLAAAFLTCVTGAASAAGESARVRADAQVAQLAQQGKMAVVVVSAKRLSAAEKAAL